jgi:branched-subunit amino acid transport protein
MNYSSSLEVCSDDLLTEINGGDWTWGKGLITAGTTLVAAAAIIITAPVVAPVAVGVAVFSFSLGSK